MSKAMDTPTLLELLLQIDFISITAKPILPPSSSIARSDPEAGRTAFSTHSIADKTYC